MERKLIKKDLSSIEASREEMSTYRQNLKMRLDRGNVAPEKSKKWFQAMFSTRGLRMSVPLTAMILILIYLQPSKIDFHQNTLYEIHELLLHTESEILLKQAEITRKSGDELESLNAALVFCLMQPSDQDHLLVLGNLEKEKRPEFRAVYLEYLLDFSEQLPLTMAKAEQLFEAETDHQCRGLYKILLKYGRLSS